MTSNVVDFPGITLNDIDPNGVLEGAKEKLKCILLIGFEHDGSLYVAASNSDMGHNLFMVEMFKHRLMCGDFGDPSPSR